MKLSKFALLPILSAGLLAGCGASSGGGEVTLTIWEDSSNIAVVEKLARDFVRDYRSTYVSAPSINIKVIEHKEASAISDLGSGIAESGEGPDIAAVTSDTIASGVANSLLAEAMFTDSVKAKMTKDAVNAVTVTEEGAGSLVYGYPITAESVTVMYDKRQITAAQLASMETLKASGKKLGITLTGDNGGFYTYGLYTDSVLFGNDGLDPTDVDLDTPETVKNVTKFYKDYLDCFLDATPEQAFNYVGNQIAGFVTTPFMLASMKEKLGDNFGIAKLPTIEYEGNQLELRPFSGYKAYVVNRYSPNGAIAHALCNYITDYAAQAYRLSQKGYLPACPLDATADIEYLIEHSAEAGVFADSLDDSVRMPSIPQMYNFWSKMNIACTNFKTQGANITEEYVSTQLQAVETALK